MGHHLFERLLIEEFLISLVVDPLVFLPSGVSETVTGVDVDYRERHVVRGDHGFEPVPLVSIRPPEGDPTTVVTVSVDLDVVRTIHQLTRIVLAVIRYVAVLLGPIEGPFLQDLGRRHRCLSRDESMDDI